MGRSKFPGKPSKSINRKRISVLQIGQHEESKTAGATKQQGGGDEEDNLAAPATTSSATAVKNNNKNGRKNGDDDEDDEDGKNGSGGGGIGSSEGQAKAATNGGGSSSASNSNNKKVNGSSDGQKNGGGGTSGGSTDCVDIANCNENNVGNVDSPENDEGEEDADEKDNDGDDDSEENEDSLENDNGDKKTSNGLNCKKLKKPNKKFQNLNILKPEVMLPSSSKQNRNCFSPTISFDNNPFANHVDVNAKPGSEKLHKKSDAQTSSESKVDKADSTTFSNTPPTVSSLTNPSSNDETHTTIDSSGTSKPKKSVTFKNIPETSDDKCAVKKFYNPNNRIPLVSIMKKECMNRSQHLRSGECIVRPSRLDEILKNKNNIDKLDSLKFRPSLLSISALSSTTKSDPFTINSLSRAFGAPDDEDAITEASGVLFRNAKESNVNELSESDGNFKTVNQERTESEVNDDDDGGDDCDDEQQMIVDKHFILPKRSTRSSRVIKPNKRLVEYGIICRKSALSNKLKSNANTSNLTATSTAVSLLNKPNSLLAPKKEGLTPTTIALESSNLTSMQKNYFGFGNYYETKVGVEGLNLLSSTKHSKNFTEMKPNMSVLTTALKQTTAPSSINTGTFTSCNSTFGTFGSLKANSNFILRQPRLQFESLNERISCNNQRGNTLPTTLISQKPIFATSALGVSATSVSNSSLLMGNLNCTICDSKIHSKNMQQLRKYGGLVCAICRKFILKVTKKSIAASASPTSKPLQLYCKNDGICCIQPSAKSKNFKKIYKERCSACWLKKCMQSLQFSTIHKQRLSSVITTVRTSHSSSDSKRVLQLNITKEPTITTPDNERTVSLTCLKKEPGLLSPTGASTVTALGTGRLPTINNATAQKWKTTDSLKLNLKTNPLAENNVTFGSTPLLRPAILEKPLFSISSNSNSSTNTIYNAAVTDVPIIQEKMSAANTDSRAETNAEKLTSKTKRKHKDKERAKDKDKEKEKEKNRESEKESVRSYDLENATTHGLIAKDVENANTEKLVEDISDNNNGAISCGEFVSASDLNTGFTPTSLASAACSSSTNANCESHSVASETTKRQRIDLKGPRVKHVCRSASIVLGQPLAMFGESDEESEDAEKNKCNILTPTTVPPDHIINNNLLTPSMTASAISVITDENDNCSTCTKSEQTIAEKHVQESLKSTSSSMASTSSTTAILMSRRRDTQDLAITNKQQKDAILNTKTTVTTATKSLSLPLVQSKCSKSYNINTTATAKTTQISKKYMRHLSYNNNIENSQIRDAAYVIASKPLISIDFWENYDPAEVCQTGFGLIITEPVAQRALCFLCGSAGLDPLIFCACCCEPYHQYCVLDEYNLKHSSLDDTMASLLDISVQGTNASTNDGAQLLRQRLNWLCPRCTVCYTCNMSSGSKVKCQKCQKNYHSTCLGTSKRLLGADRPLICVNCLKCKSCSTTKVSKFIGNLPLCMPCFKLRKRGNFCPICQKCYEDNDSDPKTMECGECKQWVHSKCEALSDEQYNLLSTLPETIEFICKKCARRNEHSKQRADEWRQVVMEEFKSSLMSVLKLLSKSHQACALLKLSPRKKVNCICGADTMSSGGNGRVQPKTLLFNTTERDPLGSDGESQGSEDIYEFNESQCFTTFNIGSTKLTTNTKCTCGAYNALLNAANSNGSATAFNSYYNSSAGTPQQAQILSLVEIKKKIANNLYTSLAEFNYDMNNAIQVANSDELIIAYKEILSEQFPWFQNETKACTDALEEDMFESCASYGMSNGGGASELCDNNYGTSANVSEELDGNERVIDLPPQVDEIVFSYKSRQDARLCLFCRKVGEGVSNEESRLLYCGQDCWVHTNCALWSAEVFEEIDGSLQNVHSAVSRGRMIKCTVCGNRGATVGCNVRSCGEHYHYPCARSISCAFFTDKTMYCPQHALDAKARSTSSNVSVETNFETARPVYVELDRRRKKLIEPQRVKFHIGSLEVKQLGLVFPRFSDTFEAIVPVNFLCSRLYWSCKQPWKIVEYTVRTTIQNSCATLTTPDMGKNFTVDHSNSNNSLVQLGLAQIARWHSSLSRNDVIEIDNGPSGLEFAAGGNRTSTNISKLLPEFLPHLQNSMLTTNTTDDNTEEEPQTNADLLPPDLKDAIFEDLPHELLDGISMLDIFPKFMNYEDLGNPSDCKTEAFLNDQSKDGVSIATTGTAAGTTPSSNMSDNDDTMNSALSKQLELSNSWSSSSTTNSTNINHVEDAMLGAARCQFKRSLSVDCYKAESLLRRVGGSSMSAAAVAFKRRKLSKSNAESVALSLSQQQRLKKDTITAVALARRQSQCTEADYLGNPRAKAFTWSAAKRYMDAAASENSADFHGIKLMQVDGVDDSITEYRIINAEAQLNGTVKCERCHCTYRNYDSFQRHLGNCEPLSTSESDSDRAPSSSPGENVNATFTTASLISTNGLNTEFGKLGRGASNVTTSGAANLPFIQAFQQATAAGIPLSSVQTATSIGGIPIANMQGLSTTTHGVQGLQNLQGFQNLQNLQFQNFQPQGIGGGNFFISQAAPTPAGANGVVVSGADELQFFSNAVQNLTANLNGTYTLAPTSGYTVQPQNTTTQQPQLIAVSTNPDGSQQIVQLPTPATAAVHNPQFIQTGTNGFSTLQATNVCDKKFVLPITNKPISVNKLNTKSGVPPTVASAAAKQKLKANSNLKPIQTKIAPNTGAAVAGTTPQITVINAANGVGNGQLISQSLLQQLQAAANAQQQPLLFQAGSTGQSAQQTPLIMQQPTQNIISFMTPDGAQYVSIPTNDFKAQPNPTASYITAQPAATGGNSLLQGATFLQTDASGNLVLTTAPAAPATTNGHLQMLSATPLNQTQIIGTLIQPQTLQLNGNVLTAAPTAEAQQSLIIGGTSSSAGGNTGLEMIAAANSSTPQVILATQPMYYGLETIVQNTVMSSQQFVSTAMPGVLSQNASFSATTTQVFQASKIEPLVDLPAGYVVLNNVEATPSAATQQQSAHSFLNASNLLQQQPATSADHQQSNNIETLYRLQQQQSQASNSAATTTTTYQFASAQQQPQIVTAKIQPVITQMKQRNNNATTATNAKSSNKVQPQVVNKVMPTSIAQQQNKITNLQKQQQQTKVVIQHQQQQQQQQTNLFMRPALPANVAATIDSQATQHIILTQQPTASKPTTTTYDSNQVITHESHKHQIYTTTVQPMTASITLATSQPPPTTVTSSKTLTQTTSARKTNGIRPINKVEVKPKVLKNANSNASTSNATFSKTTTNMATIKLKPTENLSVPITVATATQPELQYNTITTAHGNEKIEQQINVQQPHAGSILYDQQQQQTVEYQINEQNTITETFKQQQNEGLSANSHIGNNTNRLQFSGSNNNVLSSNVPTNVVNPIQFATLSNSHNMLSTTTATTTSTTLTSRPTNRVLPMQQKQQQQDNNRVNNTNCNILNNSNVSNNKQQLQHEQQTTNSTTTKCYASPNANSKSCFETEITKKIEDTNLEQYLQVEQVDQLQHNHEAIQVLHMQQERENGEIAAAISFTVPELKNGDLEIQQTPNSKLEQAVNNLPSYECSTNDNNDCLLDEKQRKKLIAAAYALNSDANNAMTEDVTSNVANDSDNIDDDDDDGFSLKMPTDDDDAMDLDHEVSDSDEPAVKAKISRILDNLTNDDCADSITTATTLEANVSIDNLQRIQFINTVDTCNSDTTKNSTNNSNLNSNDKHEATISESVMATATYIDQIPTENEYVADASTVFKKFKADLTSTTTISEKVAKSEKPIEKPMPGAASSLADNVQTNQTQHTQQHPTSYFTPKDPKKIIGPHLLYEIQSEDGFTYKSTSITDIWEKVFEAVQVARRAHGLAPLPEGPLADMSGVQMIGLKTNALKYLIEQLPGVEKCSKYTPKYHKRAMNSSSSAASASGSAVSSANCEIGSCTSTLDYSSDQEDLHENPYDCARCEPYRYRSEYDMFSWLASRHRKQPIQVFVQPPDSEIIARRGTGSNLPMAMKYRTLKETYKDYVGVFRSHIHGRGLYCTKDIEAGEMVIEYAGELIRSSLTDKRERSYNDRSIGCYMFKIDENLVVDATIRGNAARFINHSCEPNCYSKVVDILGHKHIIIFTLRRIVQGEELTYDYKFPFEEEKIPCSCGSKKCRKYLN